MSVYEMKIFVVVICFMLDEKSIDDVPKIDFIACQMMFLIRIHEQLL